MIASAIVSLREESSWEPGRLTAEVFRWPAGNDRQAVLADLVTVLTPDAWADDQALVITPGSLDPVSYGIRRRSRKHPGSVHQVRSGDGGVHPGDLLVPLSPNAPVVLVHPGLAGALIASTFLVLRPYEDLVDGLGLWLWGVLNSSSGQDARSRVEAGAQRRANSRAAILELKVPLPPDGLQGTEYKSRLSSIEVQTHRPEEEATGTWWRTADLRDGDWQRHLVTSDPTALEFGLPLGELCTEVTGGRFVRPEATSKWPAPGFLAMTDISVIRGKPVRRWVPLTPDPPVVAHPGDVLVSAIGERPNAFLVREDTAVHHLLWLLRLRDPDQGPGLVQYLNGDIGYDVRRALLKGTTILRISKPDLLRLPVRPENLEAAPDAGEPSISLDMQLEHALWS